MTFTDCNGTNNLEIFVFGNEERILLSARFDNLGKGASGAAVQNMNLVLGVDEATGYKAQSRPDFSIYMDSGGLSRPK